MAQPTASMPRTDTSGNVGGPDPLVQPAGGRRPTGRAAMRAAVEYCSDCTIRVYVPPQECCGMPFLVEGDQQRAVDRAVTNVERLLAVSGTGDDIVASCPTCGFYFKVLLRANTQFARDAGPTPEPGGPATGTAPGDSGTAIPDLLENAYRGGYEDDGAFASIPAAERIAVADAVVDTGDYLARLDAHGGLDTDFAPVPLRVAYFPPCHLRTQQPGRPYADLLRKIPGLTVEIVGEDACCGMGGNVGFKTDVHKASLDLGRPLFEAIERAAPDAIATDCLSCRLQFDHALGMVVYHPMELLARAYAERPAAHG